MAAEPAYSYPLRVALLGAGSVGTAVAELLKKRGHQIVSAWSRSAESRARAAEALDAPVVTAPPAAVEGADVVLLGAADGAIERVAREMAPGLQPDSVVVHFAGAMGMAPLEPVVAEGAHRAALHPVQSVPDAATGVDRLPGSAWGVTCDPVVKRWAHSLIEDDLGGRPMDVAEDDRALWHAAAVMTSNGIAALMSTGAALLAGLGITDPNLVLGPLATGTVDNVRASDRAGNAYTGPVVRGDRATVERHLAALSARFPELRREYALIARAIVSGASRTNRIEDDVARSMHALLESA